MKPICLFCYGIAIAGLLVVSAAAQYGGATGSTGGSPRGRRRHGRNGGGRGATAGYNFHSNYHIGFDRPEAWGLKYFASASLLSGLQPPDATAEGRRVGAVSIAFEIGWLPQLDAGQTRIGFYGKAPEDLNKAPIFARPVVRVQLPWKLTAVAAVPPPFETFGITPRLFAFGVERPIAERGRWAMGWRGYGQLGYIEGAFTCPNSVLGFAPGSAGNPTGCVGVSADRATLRYAGSEFQFAYRRNRASKVSPHLAIGGNWIDGAFQVNAPVKDGLDRTRLWTRGGTLSSSAGVSCLLSSHTSFTVDAFYSPLWVQRSPGAPTTNDGLFNVRALVSYSFR